MRPLDYLRFLEEKVAAAATRAWKERHPGGLTHGLGHVSVARNRRAVYFDGSALVTATPRTPASPTREGTSDDSLDGLFLWRDGRLVGMALTLYCPS